MKKKRKKSLVGWMVREHNLKYHRDAYGWGDTMNIGLFRGNPNPNNRTDTNHWKKVRITIEEV